MAAHDPLLDTTMQKGDSQPRSKSDAEGKAESGVPAEDVSHMTLEGKDDVCADCEKAHLPRRIVICHDGTWMLPDGAIGE